MFRWNTRLAATISLISDDIVLEHIYLFVCFVLNNHMHMHGHRCKIAPQQPHTTSSGPGHPECTISDQDQDQGISQLSPERKVQHGKAS